MGATRPFHPPPRTGPLGRSIFRRIRVGGRPGTSPLRRTLRLMAAPRTILVSCLAGVCIALLLIGIESDTLPRHIVQILPAVAVLVVAARRPAWGALAAIPIFAFWTLVMVLIWLFLLGLSTVATGRYTVFEIVMTMVIASLCIAGMVSSMRIVSAPTWSHRAIVLIVFVLVGAVQVATMRAAFLLG
jgi:hypothetical protein